MFVVVIKASLKQFQFLLCSVLLSIRHSSGCNVISVVSCVDLRVATCGIISY